MHRTPRLFFPSSLVPGTRAMTALTVSAFVAGGLASGCAGSETGNAQVDLPELRPIFIEMMLSEAVPTEEQPTAVARDGEELVAERAVARVVEIEFILSDELACRVHGEPSHHHSFLHEWCRDGDRLRLEGDWTVDLMTGRFDPPLEGLTLPAVAFDKVQVKLKGVGREPSITVSGQYDVGAGPARFDFELTGTVPAAFQIDGPLEISEDLWGIGLDMAFQTWLTEVDLRPCLEARQVGPNNGRLQIHAPSNRACAAAAWSMRQALMSRPVVKVKVK